MKLSLKLRWHEYLNMLLGSTWHEAQFELFWV